jgi:short-subunit dehydrogenase
MMKRTTVERRAPGWIKAGVSALAFVMLARALRERVARQRWQAASQAKHGAALVTGASSGIGQCFAMRLAARGHDLILVARREDRLRQLAEELGAQYGVAVEVLAADLTNADDLERVAQRIAQMGALEILVNNAGFGISGPFAESDIERQVDMVELHAIASIRLLRAALPGMLAHQHGGIINVSSNAAFFALPQNANYSATKAYLNVFTESLHYELVGAGVRVQALCPGFTYSEFHDQANNMRREQIPGFLWMHAEPVVEQSLEALARGQVIFSPGWQNKLIALLGRSGLASAAMRWGIG